jgi:hypothetical protein
MSDYEKHFSRPTIVMLRKKGITIIGATHLPDEKGSYANGETGYELNNNGQYQIRTYLQVIDMAKLAK